MNQEGVRQGDWSYLFGFRSKFITHPALYKLSIENTHRRRNAIFTLFQMLNQKSYHLISDFLYVIHGSEVWCIFNNS